MNQTGIFIAGAVVTIIVFTGAFLYAMLTFNRLAGAEEVKADQATNS